jgi:oxygen-independent coproporphyrinogen-3 oxidase
MAGIYIHVPFCKQACHYCNFYFSTSLTNKDAFVKALLLEIELSKDYLAGDTIETIYFGGGTPSLLSADEIKNIVYKIQNIHQFSHLREFTLEANPDDLDAQKVTELSALKEIGLNRFSIGVQSFFDEDLKYMNRAHTSGEATAAIKRTQDAGFENITLDLIYGTPTMNDAHWLQNLNTAFTFNIPHISSYALTVEAKTTLENRIKKGKSAVVDEEQASRQFDILIHEMNRQNYDQYEISNFAKDGNYAIHNTSYWQQKKYLGLGPSAHSYNGNSRRWNVANNLTYIKSVSESKIPFEEEQLTSEQQANEYIMTSLRTMWGLDLKQFSVGSFQLSVLESLKTIDADFYVLENDIITLTQKGKHFADRIASDLFL